MRNIARRSHMQPAFHGLSRLLGCHAMFVQAWQVHLPLHCDKMSSNHSSPAEYLSVLQGMELLQHGKGLRWIANQEPAQILLIPGVHSASIAAAGEGDQEAVAYLRFAAQYFVAHGSMQNLNDLDIVCLAGSAITAAAPFRVFWHNLQARDERLKVAYGDRRSATHKILQKAAREGQLAALKWLQALCHRSYQDNHGLMRQAAEHGQLDVLKYLRFGPHPAPFDTRQIVEATICHPECFRWLMSNDLPYDSSFCSARIIGQVAKHGSFELLRWLRSSPHAAISGWTEDVMLDVAARPNCLPTVQWLRTLEPPVPWSAAVCEAAAHRGDVSLLQWLRGQDPPCPWTASCSAAAVNSRQHETLQWMGAQQPPCPFSEECTSAAVRNGDQLMLRWLRAQVPPCPMASACCQLAVECGDLPMLQLLSALQPPCRMESMGCTWDAVQRGDLAMLEWLFDSQPLALRRQLYYHAAAAGHLHVLRWLRARAVPAPIGSPHIPPQNNTAALMFLGDIGAPLTQKASQDLQQARRTLATFYGLLRWCRRAVSNPAKGIHRAFDPLCSDTSRQNLLIRLSRLPPELVNKIAVAAGLQHDLI